MSEPTIRPEERVLIQARDQSKNKKIQVSLEELLDSLRSVQNDIGQISELTSEEETVVNEFFESFLKLMQPFTATISVSPEALPDDLGDVRLASLDPTGQLMLMYRDGYMILRNLREEENRDLMTAVLEGILPTLKQIFGAHREKIEGRMKFLLSITKEVQKMAKAVSRATS